MDILEENKLRAFHEKRQKEIEKENEEISLFLSDAKSFGEYFKLRSLEHKNLNAIFDEYSNVHKTYEELEQEIDLLSSGLQAIGVKKGDFVCLFSENNGRWVSCDQAIARCGAISTLRGINAPLDELQYIISHSEAKTIFLQNKKTFLRLKSILENAKISNVILMFDEISRENENEIYSRNFQVFSYEEILNKGKEFNFEKPEIKLDDWYSMLYTSGTTGDPKGAIITHKNILTQVYSINKAIELKAGEKGLEILPIWHAYERTLQYSWFIAGMFVHFTNLPNLRKDLARYKVDVMCSVPRIWETMRVSVFQKVKQASKWKYYFFDLAVRISILYKFHKMYSERRLTNKKTKYKIQSRIYHKGIRLLWKPTHFLMNKYVYSKIRDTFGLNFRISISGGGSLPMKDELFYDALGVNLREGYGLTETSPVVVIRRSFEPNFLGTAGKPLDATEIKIVDPETKEEMGMYKKGLILVKGPQVMSCYYKNKEATDDVLKDGWFNTGDLGWITKDNNLIIVGRAKETIVLSSGENVEPVPIESACLESPYIEQIVLVGQDESSVGALVVPSEDAFKKCGLIVNELRTHKNVTIQDVSLRELIKSEINTYIKKKSHLKPFEKIKQFEVLLQGFNTENGMLNQVSKIKRNVIFEKYKNLIKKMFSKEKK